MFSRREYETPGPGVDPNAPEKTGFRRLLEIVQLECATLFQLNLLFLVSCLPVITLPPALFAMNQVIRRMVLDQPVDCFYHYRTAFRRYWKQAYGGFFALGVPMVCAGFGASFYLRYAAENLLSFLPFMLCSTVFLVVLLASTYLYGLLGTDHRLGESLRLSLLLGMGRPLRAVLAALCSYGVLLLCIIEFPLSAGFLLLIGFSVPCLLSNFFTRTILRPFTPEPTPVLEPEPDLSISPGECSEDI